MTNSWTMTLLSHRAADRNLVLVLGGKDPRHVVGLGSVEQDLGGDHLPGQIGAEHRHDQPETDKDQRPNARRAASSTVAIEGWRKPAISARGKTA